MQAFERYDPDVPNVAPTVPPPVAVPSSTAPSTTTTTATTTPPAPARAAVTTAADPPALSLAATVVAVPPSTVARVNVPVITVYASPSDSSPSIRLLSTTDWGNPRVLLTTQLRGDWIQVLLPVRPNNSVGWVRARDVTLSELTDAIDVDLGSRTLTWTRAGAVMLQVPAAIGAPNTPTPPGTFYVTDVIPEDAGGPYGAWALVLSSRSDAMTTFDGGDPRIAIHGTNAPSSIGNAASNGCIRLAADPLAALAAAIAPGTPVTVH